MIISLDTETQGVDFYHGARPFLVTLCRDNGDQLCWGEDWKIDPLTRKVTALPEDLREMQHELDVVAGWGKFPDEEIRERHAIVGHNIRFDVKALTFLFKDHGMELRWPWSMTHDTLIAGHLLASNQPHNLTDMVLFYLALDIEPLEKGVESAVKSARTYCRNHLESWRIADYDLPEMPSLQSANKKNRMQPWRFDYWLPRMVRIHCESDSNNLPLPKSSDDWPEVTEEYANKDAEVSLLLWIKVKSELQRKGLWKIYKESNRLPEIVTRMEGNGVTMHLGRTEEKYNEFREASDASGAVCTNLAATYGKELVLPKSGLNNSLREFCFETLKLPVVEWTDKGNPSLDKNALAKYLNILPDRTIQRMFITSLTSKRSKDTALTYIDGYKRFAVPTKDNDWVVLYPNLNITGSDTLRFSSTNPNSQNISRQSESNLRYMFGPPPGWEWWSLDYENLELRLPAYEAGETAMIELFERPKDPPYYGSYHLLTAHILHKNLFETCKGKDGKLDGRIFKSRYENEWYKPIKNGNFAVQYGAMQGSGTADRAYRVEGAQEIIQSHLSKVKVLSEKTLKFAEKHGYVETLPDKTVDSSRGYPLLCTRTDKGRVLPTVPFSYKIQGTAMWCTRKAMVRCDTQLQDWKRGEGFDGRTILQVHDELVFAFPRGDNRARVGVLKSLMEKSGDDIGIPLKVSAKRHLEAWSIEDE